MKVNNYYSQYNEICGHPCSTKRGTRRYWGKGIGPILVKRKHYIRGYNNTRHVVTHWFNGNITYY